MMEEWRPIPGHQGYEVSNLGQVRSLDRWITTKRGVNKFQKGRVLAIYRNPSAKRHSDRYPFVQLGRGNPRHVHRLVAWAFLGSQAPGLFACHYDGDYQNSHVSNIYYGTAKENQADRIKHGTSNRGERHGNAVLSDKDIKEIRKELARGALQKELADRFGVTQPSISNIKRGVQWSHV
jgi:hypothetical protein